MKYHVSYVKKLLQQKGPDKDDYDDLDIWIQELVENRGSGEVDDNQLITLINTFGDAFSTDTMQGFAFIKPHGYAGDYEIIERIYNHYVSPKPHLTKWDAFWQEHAAAKAVRNRKQYFIKLIKSKMNDQKILKVLNLASGPGRDMYEFFTTNPDAPVYFDCVEQDDKAVAYASRLCRKYRDNITFIQKNALKYRTDTRYDLIWSAGLFDYFTDRIFSYMLVKLQKMLKAQAEMVIGNFSINNPSMYYMKLMDWNLYHRSRGKLVSLALQSGFNRKQIMVHQENTGVNLFLHMKSE